jgi:hypothetical protein
VQHSTESSTSDWSMPILQTFGDGFYSFLVACFSTAFDSIHSCLPNPTVWILQWWDAGLQNAAVTCLSSL